MGRFAAALATVLGAAGCVYEVFLRYPSTSILLLSVFLTVGGLTWYVERWQLDALSDHRRTVDLDRWREEA